MNKKIIIGVLVLVAIFGIYGFINLPDSSSTQTATAEQQEKLSFEKVSSEVSSGAATLYDVRTLEEFNEGNFENSVNLSLQSIQSGKLPEVDKSSKIFVYCKSGNRSAQATTILKQAGYTNIVDLGGLSDVESIGGKLLSS